jgi:hypothetical protein
MYSAPMIDNIIPLERHQSIKEAVPWRKQTGWHDTQNTPETIMPCETPAV